MLITFICYYYYYDRFVTRDAFMRNVMNQQNITHYPKVLELIRQSEQLFHAIQQLELVIPLQDEERLFIDAIRDMNYQASRMQEEEKQEAALAVHTVRAVVAASSSSAARMTPDNNNHKSPTTIITETTTHIPPTAVAASLAPNTIATITANTTATAPIIIANDDVVDKLDAATSLAVETARRLNQNNHSPNVSEVLSWMHNVSIKRIQQENTMTDTHQQQSVIPATAAAVVVPMANAIHATSKLSLPHADDGENGEFGTDQEALEENESIHSPPSGMEMNSSSLLVTTTTTNMTNTTLSGKKRLPTPEEIIDVKRARSLT
jgi:hypothetical protein